MDKVADGRTREIGGGGEKKSGVFMAKNFSFGQSGFADGAEKRGMKTDIF